MFENLYNLFFNEGRDLEKVIKDAYSKMTDSYVGNKKISPLQIAESMKVLNQKVERHLKDKRLELEEQINEIDLAIESIKEFRNE